MQNIPKLHIPIKKQNLPKVKEKERKRKHQHSNVLFVRKSILKFGMNSDKQERSEIKQSRDLKTYRLLDGPNQARRRKR
jgi:hypothetical protein